MTPIPLGWCIVSTEPAVRSARRVWLALRGDQLVQQCLGYLYHECHEEEGAE